MFGAYYFGQPYFGEGPADVPVVAVVLPSVAVSGAYTPILTLSGASGSIAMDGYTITFTVAGAHEPTRAANGWQGTTSITGAVE